METMQWHEMQQTIIDSLNQFNNLEINLLPK
jgi:hypothetical protein